MDDHVLVATDDPLIAEHAVRWCTAAGVAHEPATDLGQVRRSWRSARMVLLGEDLVAAVAAESWTRRDDVRLVTREPDAWWRAAVEVGAVDVLGLDDDAAAVEALGTAIDGRAEGCGVVVVGGSGGVGATTFAGALALEAARRQLRSAVVDADPSGPGIDLVLGAERAEGLRWSALGATDGRVAPESLAGALPQRDGVATISWAVDDDAAALPPGAERVWTAAVRAFDLVVVDQSRGDSGAGWQQTVLGSSVMTLVVVGDGVAALASARRVVAGLRPRAAALGVVRVRRRGGPGARTVEDALGVPVVATVGPDRRLREALDHGRGPGGSRRLRRAARDVLDLIGLGGER